MRSVLLALTVLATPLAAQEASPYVPVGHWAMPFVEHLIAAGRMADPSPLSRPLRVDELMRALAAVDSNVVTGSEWAVVKRIRGEFDRKMRGPSARMDVNAGIAGASHARRDPLRAAGVGHATFNGGAALTFYFGPAVVFTHPYFDTRLKWDPDYYGKKDRVIAGRFAESYISGQWRYAEVFFGSMDRNWGPRFTQGLLVSPSPYSYDQLDFKVGTAGIYFEGILTQLDDLADTAGVMNQRHFVAHRLVVRPPWNTTFALWEGTITAGEGRDLEPWFANIFSLGLIQQYDQNSPSNNLLGFDVTTRIKRTQLFGSVLIDDIQVDNNSAGDQEPSSYGLTLGAQGGISRVGWTAFYTQISNLAYRTPSPPEIVMRRNVGLARNFSDYDQLTLRGSVIAGPGALIEPEITLLRQGEGDFRLPYPTVAQFDSTPTLFAGVVERTVRLALAGRVAHGRWVVSGDGGVHLIDNYQHVDGSSKTKWVGRIALEWRTKKEGRIP
ncbi:MAG TPA: capsule assembly Wzi family protein [Gemmatimonadales bacterium]|nr:capsule assembly Wzi family protein [Gemmatimonadales bacterium]